MSEIERWVETLPEGRERAAGIQALTSMQTNETPDLIDSIASKWPAGPERDAAFRGIASSIGRNDPVRSLEFAQQITDPKMRWKAFNTAAWSVWNRDKPAARAFINSASVFSPDEKRVLIRQFDEW